MAATLPARDAQFMLRLVLLVVCVAPVVAASALLGPTHVAWSDIVGTSSNPAFWQFRVPRTLLAAAAGAGLAVGGVMFQALFRNPLATPYTLGIDAGAALGAAAGFLAGVSGRWSIGWGWFSLGVPKLAALTFAGAMIALLAIFLMSRLRGGQDMTHLLLAGVCVAYLSTACIALIIYVAQRAVTNQIVEWTMGSLATLRPQAAGEVGLVLLLVLLYGLMQHRALDLLSMGDQLAAARGVAVPRVVWMCFGLVGLLTAVIVANCGPIGFVGLMVPHMARALLGERSGPLLIGSAVLGAAFLAVCDGVARSSAYELPVGIVTNILGASFFFYLLSRGEHRR